MLFLAWTGVQVGNSITPPRTLAGKLGSDLGGSRFSNAAGEEGNISCWFQQTKQGVQRGKQQPQKVFTPKADGHRGSL